MDKTDRLIADLVQRDGRASSAEIAEAVGVSVSTANERVRRLSSTGAVSAWRGILDPTKAGAAFCAFILLDMSYDGEEEACRHLLDQPEVQELHHISGPHSYLMKVRVYDTAALQMFLQEVVKPLQAVNRTETILSLSTLKETTLVKITPAPSES